MSKEKDRVVELKNKKIVFISIVLVVLFSLGYFGFQAFEEATYKYHSVEDLLSSEDGEQDLNIGLKAMLVPNTYVRSADGLSFSDDTVCIPSYAGWIKDCHRTKYV